MHLSIIIVNYNVKYFLEQCLRSVVNACENIAAEIIVVDNNSTDDSRPYLTGKFEQVKFIWHSENIGFGRANNLALQSATGDCILFLNPDTIMAEDCLDKCMEIFRSRPSVGALGVKMIDGSGNFLKESKRAFPSPLTSLFKLSGLCALFPRSGIFAKYYLGNLDEKDDHEVDVIAGAFMMISKKSLDKVGGFDEIFFMYGEDVDLSFRLQKIGLKNYYYAGTSIIHFKGESTNKQSFDYIRLFYGAMILFVKKHYSSGFTKFYSLLIHLAIWIKAVFSGAGYLWDKIRFLKKKEMHHTSCLVLAGKTDYELIKDALLKEIPQRIVIELYVSDATHEQPPTYILLQIKKAVRLHDIGEIVFSCKNLSAKNIIAMVEQMGPGFGYRFHLPETGSIVGSESKDSPGSFLAID